MPRRSYALTTTTNTAVQQSPHPPNSATDPEKQQLQWRRRIRSTDERSSNAVNIDGFASMRRRKIEDNNPFRKNPKPSAIIPPIPYPRNYSLFSVRLSFFFSF